MLDIAARTFFSARRADPEFARAFNQARLDGFELLAERMRQQARDEPDVARLREMGSADRWYLEKMAPHRFGQLIQVAQTQAPNLADVINQGIEEGRARVAAATQALPNSKGAAGVVVLERVSKSDALDAPSVYAPAGANDDEDGIP